MVNSPFLEINLDKNKEIVRNDFELNNTIIEESFKKKQRREDWKHKITHLLAITIILTFILIILYYALFNPCKEWMIPTYFISIVSYKELYGNDKDLVDFDNHSIEKLNKIRRGEDKKIPYTCEEGSLPEEPCDGTITTIIHH